MPEEVNNEVIDNLTVEPTPNPEKPAFPKELDLSSDDTGNIVLKGFKVDGQVKDIKLSELRQMAAKAGGAESRMQEATEALQLKKDLANFGQPDGWESTERVLRGMGRDEQYISQMKEAFEMQNSPNQPSNEPNPSPELPQSDPRVEELTKQIEELQGALKGQQDKRIQDTLEEIEDGVISHLDKSDLLTRISGQVSSDDEEGKASIEALKALAHEKGLKNMESILRKRLEDAEAVGKSFSPRWIPEIAKEAADKALAEIKRLPGMTAHLGRGGGGPGAQDDAQIVEFPKTKTKEGAQDLTDIQGKQRQLINAIAQRAYQRKLAKASGGF